MASSYALPSSQVPAPFVGGAGVSDFRQDSPGYKSHSHSHSHRDSHGTGWHTARSSVSGLERKEVLHGTGVALQPAGQTQLPTRAASPPTAPSSGMMQEAATGVLLVLPFLFASQIEPRENRIKPSDGTYNVQELAMLKEQVLATEGHTLLPAAARLVEAMILASAVLLLLGILGKLMPGRRSGDGVRIVRNKKSQSAQDSTPSSKQIRGVALLVASLVLPFHATFLLSGWRVALLTLLCYTRDLKVNFRLLKADVQTYLRTQWCVVALMSIGFVDLIVLVHRRGLSSAIVGYIAVLVWLTLLPTGDSAHQAHDERSAQIQLSSASTLPSARDMTKGSVFLLSSLEDDTTTLIAGGVLAVITALLSSLSGASISLSASAIVIRTISISATVLAIYFARPSTLRSRQKSGFCLGIVLCLAGILFSSQSSWAGILIDLMNAVAFASAVLLDGKNSRISFDATDASSPLTTRPTESMADTRLSPFTQLLIQRCEPDSLMHSILIEKDSRRIAYFTCLNFAFMLVQGLYGYLSGSLGLLSDTVHMFFDCLGLVVGLGAAVASRWPPSPERPFGWGQLNTLAGFGNGIFLMLVSVEFAWEAVEGILDGHELRRVKELLVVSTLGLLINMVGLFAFGHAHAGHDHSHAGHDHSHGHSHAHHEHEHHTHSPLHAHTHDHHDHHDTHTAHHADKHDHNHNHNHNHTHSHAHNENMHGIFLHVAADAGGSLAVIISTALTLMKPWYLWDPLATILIAVLIFAAAVPLVQSSGRKLLLIIPDETEHGVKSFLQEVTEVRGTLGYAAPRFWLSNQTSQQSHAHGHGDAHHDCDHDHEHSSEPQPALVGSVHIIAAPFADLEDVRERVQELAVSKGIQATLQVEYETDAHCWCGGSQRL